MNRLLATGVLSVTLCFFSSLTGYAATRPSLVVPTTYPQMAREVMADQRRSPLIRVSTIGYSKKHKLPILLVQIGKLSPKSIKVMVLCRQHGDEPAGTEGALAVIGKLSTAPNAAKELGRLCLFIVPMVNPDGAEAETRVSGDLADLNRDWGIFHQPETRAVKNAVLSIRPSFILDVHSWDSVDPFQQVCVEGPRSREGFGPALLSSIADLQARAAYGLEASSGQPVAATTYGTDAMSCLAHRYFLRSDHIASLLFETGPGPNYGASLATRTALVKSMLYWLILDTSMHPAAWAKMAEAEPAYESILPKIAIAAIPRPAPEPTPGPKFDRRSWMLFGICCALIVWLGIKGRISQAKEKLKSPPRYRRLQHTSKMTPECLVLIDRAIHPPTDPSVWTSKQFSLK
jgi:hypothetical protein